MTLTHPSAGRLAPRAVLACAGLTLGLAASVLSVDAAAGQAPSGDAPQASSVLRVEKFGAPEGSFHVVSTLIVGPTESILFDGQYRLSDGRALAERIAETGTKLKAIVLSHADHDHYMGAGAVVERFPDVPIYMTRGGLDDFTARSPRDLAMERRRGPDPEVPNELIKPELLPDGALEVDGQEIIVIEGLVGDVRAPVSTALWIPSLHTVLAGDLVFEGIHPWLGDSDRASRVEWRSSLRRLAALEPAAVVPGHKRDLSTPDSPALIDAMIRYLDDFDALMEEASTPADVVEGMVGKYANLALPGLMAYGARTWFKK